MHLELPPIDRRPSCVVCRSQGQSTYPYAVRVGTPTSDGSLGVMHLDLHYSGKLVIRMIPRRTKCCAECGTRIVA